MADELWISKTVALRRDELHWRFSRSSGPGGQSVNTADSRVELRFDLAASESLPTHLRDRALARLGPRLIDGVIIITASEHRSQLRNREAAQDRLVALLAEAIAAPARARRAARPSRAEVARRLDAKRRRGDLKRQRRDQGD